MKYYNIIIMFMYYVNLNMQMKFINKTLHLLFTDISIE